jgi:hypothetical protein
MIIEAFSFSKFSQDTMICTRAETRNIYCCTLYSTLETPYGEFLLAVQNRTREDNASLRRRAVMTGNTYSISRIRRNPRSRDDLITFSRLTISITASLSLLSDVKVCLRLESCQVVAPSSRRNPYRIAPAWFA